jgi:hypothetical protein
VRLTGVFVTVRQFFHSLTVINTPAYLSTQANGIACLLYFHSSEGTTENVLQFIMPLKSIYNKDLGNVVQKNVFFEHNSEVLAIKISIN